MIDAHPAPPRLADFEAAAVRLAPRVVRTPTATITGDRVGSTAPVTLKIEFLQTAGSFKYRGALNHVLGPGSRGVLTVSSGNHGIALAEAGRRLGVRVVVMLASNANAWRRERMRTLGAEIRVADNAADAFVSAREAAAREGLHFVHPYDGVETLEGTGSLGLEFAEQAADDLDAVVVAVGGGGLAAGVAAAMRARRPDIEVFGAEPAGAPTVSRALVAGRPIRLDELDTIADSLAAPCAAPMSLALCREHLEDLVLVSDAEIVAALRAIHTGTRLTIEPSAAIGLAALNGPLRSRLAGRHVGLILCGANQDPAAQLAMLEKSDRL